MEGRLTGLAEFAQEMGMRAGDVARARLLAYSEKYPPGFRTTPTPIQGGEGRGPEPKYVAGYRHWYPL